MFFVGRSWATDEEIIALFSRNRPRMCRLHSTIRRVAEKAKADEQKSA